MQALLNILHFARVVDAGSFAEAARRAGTTTSAMSKAVARAERAYGVQLLRRTTHSLRLTDEGERLLHAARGLIREAEALNFALAEAATPSVAGSVRISAPGAFARACLLPLLPPLLARHPQLDIEISFDDSVIDLGAHAFDFAIRTGDLAGTPGIVARRLATYPMIFCAAPDYLARRGTPRTLSDLASHDLIGFRNRSSGTVLTWVAAAENGLVRLKPRFRLIVDDGTGGWAMVRDGLGLTWAPAWLGYEDLRSGRVVEVLRDARTPEVPISAVGLQRGLTPRRSRIVLDAISASAAGWS